MCLEKPSFTERPLRPVRERIELLKLDASMEAKDKIKEIIHTEVRGGIGNAKLVSWSKGSIEDKECGIDPERRLMENLMYVPLFDYKHGSKPLDVWSNIEVGKDIYRFSRNEIRNVKNAGILSLVVLVSLMAALFI